MADLNAIPTNAANLKTGVTDDGVGLPTSAPRMPSFDYSSENGQGDDVASGLSGSILDIFTGGLFSGMSKAEQKQYQRYIDKYDREVANGKYLQDQWFNANESEKQRAGEKMMSDTSTQRKMADLNAAGVNPLLAVSGIGAGASTPSGSAARSGGGSSGSSSRSTNLPVSDGTKTIGAIGMLLLALSKMF